MYTKLRIINQEGGREGRNEEREGVKCFTCTCTYV